MKKSILILIVLGIIVIIFTNKDGRLIAPATQSLSTPMPTATPAAPIIFQFDKSTDLELELEKVNPQVLDSDFNTE